MIDKRKRLVADGYDEIAEVYAKWEPSDGHGIKGSYVDRVQSLVGPGSDVLDLGCGTGAHVTRRLASVYNVVGVDISARSVELAHARIPDARFIVGDISSITFPEESFDAVIAFFSLIHVPREDHGAVLGRIASWLRPGGWFVGTMGAGPGSDGNGDFLGVQMYWSSWSTKTNVSLVRDAGLDVLTAEEATEDEHGVPVTHLWIVARRD